MTVIRRSHTSREWDELRTSVEKRPFVATQPDYEQLRAERDYLAEQLRGAVGIIETARQELRDAMAGGNPQVLREYAEDTVEAMSAFLDQPGGR